MTILSDQSGPGASRLAERLRDLREHAPVTLTQAALGQALGDAENPVSPATVSSWESPASGRLVPASRLDAYARLFATARSFEGAPHLLEVTGLTDDERKRYQDLKQELVDLRDVAVGHQAAASAGGAQSMWHFPDRSRITLVSSRLPSDRRPASADQAYLNYVRLSGLADLDALVEIHGAIRAYNPASRVVITAAQDLGQRDAPNHLVLIGGLAWETVSPLFSRIFPIPILSGDPADRGAIVVRDRDQGEREFTYQMNGDDLVEDVGFFARGENPSAPRRTLTICGGITTRGVLGAARCFVDWEMRERNEQYLFPRFPSGSTYCIVMRVPVLHGDPLTPDLSKPDNRLFEWYQPGAPAE